MEINRGYIDFQRPQPGQAVAVRFATVRRALATLAPVAHFASVRLMLLLAVWFRAYVRLRYKGRPLAPLHAEAMKRLPLFVDQYPLHPYPALCKAFELAFLHEQMPKVATGRIVELAVGDGSLSSKIYPAGATITALDISPYSLRVSAAMPHVGRAIIADCTTPPLAAGSFDLLVANNFLHHVSEKEAMLGRFARIARQAVFNENSDHWLSAWPKPYLLARIGLKRQAQREIERLGKRFLQDVWPLSAVDAAVSRHFEVKASARFLAAPTYFVCNVFARLMGAWGPPTPGFMKAHAERNPSVRRASLALCEALIRFDNAQDQSKAVFVSYAAQSRSFEESGRDLVCPRCSGDLAAGLSCASCGTTYPTMQGMAFVLPDDLAFIHSNYAERVPVEERHGFYAPHAVQQHH